MKDGRTNARRRSGLQQEPLLGSLAPGPATMSGGTEAVNPGKEDGCQGVGDSGSMARREAFQEDPSHNDSRRALAPTRDRRCLDSSPGVI